MIIPKDKCGLFESGSKEAEEMYQSLPFAVRDESTGYVDIVQDWNWYDWLSEFSKEKYKYWAKITIGDF